MLDLLLSLGLGVFIAAVSVLLIYFGAKKRGQTMDSAFYQKLAMYGVFGLICGYFSMRITIRNNPELFREKPPLSQKQIENITKNPVPQMPQSGLRSQPDVSRDQRVRAILENPIPKQPEIKLKVVDSLRKPLSQQERDERRRQSEIQRAKVDATHKAAGYDRQEDQNQLSSMTLDELERVVEERKLEKEEATKRLRELNSKDSGATLEERQAASKRFSVSVTAYMEANKARLEKKREQRGLNR